MLDPTARRRYLRTLLNAAVDMLDDDREVIPNLSVAHSRCSEAVSKLWRYAYVGPPALPRGEARQLLIELSLTAMAACLDLGLLSVDPSTNPNGG